MNDEIKKLIREILGDFPEGFNAGVVAGVPGWAGDIGYLLQEYPRALLTDTPLRPPVEYAGTTDSIAKAAGYEIPGTLSGQLGAAVGGLLSPGPGDLAAFAKLPAMFLGVKAATANQDALTLAKTLEKAGATRDEIWKATGELGQPWMKGPDGEWRFEIPDNESRMTGVLPDNAVSEAFQSGGPDAARELVEYKPPYLRPGRTMEINDVVSHSGLLDAYPELMQRGKYRLDESSALGRGAYYPESDTIALTAADEPTARNVMLHELQHAVQDREGFAKGGSPKTMGDEIDNLYEFNQKFNRAFKQFLTSPDDVAKSNARQEMDYYLERIRKLQDLRGVFLPEAAYARLAGEAEARNVQSRMNMSLHDRINTPPWMTLDVPEAQLIVRRGLLNP